MSREHREETLQKEYIASDRERTVNEKKKINTHLIPVNSENYFKIVRNEK